jgi:hypothetical protein
MLATAGLYVLGVMIFSAYVFWLNTPVYQYSVAHPLIQPSPVVGGQAGSQTGTAFLYIGLIIVSTFIMLAIIGRKRLRKKLVYGIVGLFVIESLPLGLYTYTFLPWWLVASTMAVSVIGYLLVVFRNEKAWIALPFLTLIMVGVAESFMYQFLMPYILIIPGLLAVWDMFAVLSSKGPLGKMFGTMNSGDTEIERLLRSMTVGIGGVGLGLGDLFAYTLLADVALTISHTYIEVASVIGAVLVGFLLTIYLLKTRKVKLLPALPIPVLFGLIVVSFLYLR